LVWSGCEEEPPGDRFGRRGGKTNGGGLLVGGMGEGRTRPVSELEFLTVDSESIVGGGSSAGDIGERMGVFGGRICPGGAIGPPR